MVLMNIPPSILDVVLKEYEPMIQSAVYLAQENGINFGLEFNWKHNGGVFNRELAHNTKDIIMFGLEKYIANVCDTVEQQEFLVKIKPYLDDKKWLVTASSSLYIYKDFSPRIPRMTFPNATNFIIEEMFALSCPCDTDYTHKVIVEMVKQKFV